MTTRTQGSRVSKGSAAEGTGLTGWGVKAARGAVVLVVAARGAEVDGACSQAAAHRAGSTVLVGGPGASFP